MRQEYDNPWKEVIEEAFRPFVAFLLGWIDGDVDWAHAPESREQELRKAHPSAAAGTRLVDRLVKMLKRTGDIRYLHVEVQGYFDGKLAFRVWEYNRNASSYLGEEVVSVVILVDDDPDWRPDTYRYEEWGCRKQFSWPVVKLTDWRGREDQLAADASPFALFVLGHLWSQATREDMERREALKLRLIELLASRKMDEVDTGGWLRLFDWQLQLPPEGEARVTEWLKKKRKEGIMPFVPSYERIMREQAAKESRETGLQLGIEKGMEKGMEKGLHRGALAVLKIKFGAAGAALEPRLATADVATLDAVITVAEGPASLDEIERLLP